MRIPNAASLLFSGVSLAALTLPSGAVAQNATSAPSAAAQAQDVIDTGLEEIVVTAQKREERQQNVPISITTVTAAGAERAGVTGTESLGASVPALQFSRQTGNGATPFIRGVGSTSGTIGSESPVALYVDDVYIGSPSAALQSFNNIDQIEVLKGPQGTLFGRNATGGVVSIHTRKPSQDTAIDASAGYSRFNTFDGNFYATGGITDTLAVNFAATGHDQKDGYGRDVTTGDDVYKSKYYGLRSEALWKPSSATQLLLIADYSHNNGDQGMNNTILPGYVATGGQTYPGHYKTTAVPADTNKSTQYGFSAKLDQDLGGVRLVSISAYRKNTGDYSYDNDGSTAVIVGTLWHGHTRTYSQEVQLLSPIGSPVKWIVGAIYYDENAAYDPLRFFGASQAANGGFTLLHSVQRLRSYAGFGEVSYEILPDTNITGGLRYTTDFFDEDVSQVNSAGTFINASPQSTNSDFSKLTYRAVIDHHFTKDIMTYASYSRGFKSGGYSLSAPFVGSGAAAKLAPAVSPEVLDAYEGGIKTEFFNHHLRLNLSAFKYDYSNLQVTIIGIGTSTTINAAAAKIKGIDFDFEAAPIRHLTISGGASILDSTFSNFKNGPFNVPNPAVCTPTPQTTGPRTGGGITCAADLTGNRTSRSPKFTGTIGATYTIPSDVGDFSLSGSLYHNSGFFWEPDNQITQPRYNLLSASVGWTSSNGRYEARLWGKNLTNSYYFTYGSESGTRFSASPDMPRTYGVTLGVHFKK